MRDDSIRQPGRICGAGNVSPDSLAARHRCAAEPRFTAPVSPAFFGAGVELTGDDRHGQRRGGRHFSDEGVHVANYATPLTGTARILDDAAKSKVDHPLVTALGLLLILGTGLAIWAVTP